MILGILGCCFASLLDGEGGSPEEVLSLSSVLPLLDAPDPLDDEELAEASSFSFGAISDGDLRAADSKTSSSGHQETKPSSNGTEGRFRGSAILQDVTLLHHYLQYHGSG